MKFAVLFGSTGCVSTEITHGSPADPARNWVYEPASKDEPAKLAYGREGTDDVDLMLWCDRARQRVRFTPVGADDAHFARMTLQSLSQRLDLGLGQDARLGSVGDVPLTSPLLSAFRASARMSMSLDGKWQPDLAASSPRGSQQVNDFFRACG